jgi:hypothetical protein
MHRVAAKSVLRLLSEDHKHSPVGVRKELVVCANADENFLKNTVTRDETWVYGYDIETKVVFTIGLKNITQTQKSVANSVQCESDADCVF